MIVLEIKRILERGALGDISNGQLPELEFPRLNPDPPFQRVRDDFRLRLGRVKEVLDSQIHLDQQRSILLKVLEQECEAVIMRVDVGVLVPVNCLTFGGHLFNLGLLPQVSYLFRGTCGSVVQPREKLSFI